MYLSTPTDQTFPVGLHPLTFTVSAADVRFGLKGSGPYEVSAASVTEEEGGVVVASREHLGFTGAYPLSGIYLTPQRVR